jgi:hypothetical protein
MLQQVPAPVKQPVSLGILPDAADGKYNRFAMVSRRAHLDDLSPSEDGLLLVSSSWLLWQELVLEGWPCIHIESSQVTTDTDCLAEDIYLRTNDWIYLDGDDATLFEKVSLGRKVVREVSLLILERERLFQSLSDLVERFKPEEILFYDLRAETSMLDAEGRLGIVRQIAEQFGSHVKDLTNPTGDADPNMPIRPYYGTSENGNTGGRLSAMARRSVFRLISTASKFRWILGDRRPGVLMMCSQLSSTSLLEKFANHKAVPVVPVDWLPGKGKLGYLLGCVLKGVRIPMPAQAELSAREKSEIEGSISRFEEAWREPAGEEIEYIRRYIRREVFASGRLFDIALECRRARNLLARGDIRLIFTDGLQNRTINTALEIAADHGVKTSASWHGPYIQDYKLDILGCDPRYRRVVDCALTWGDVHEKWLAAIGSDTDVIRIGNLILSDDDTVPTQADTKRENALILQYATPHADILWPQAGQYGFFVHAARAYRNAGYKNIRLKLHPGPSKIDYYQRIAELFDIDCDVVIDGPFMDHVDWADSITGPVHSGAMLEVMHAGKPYLAALYGPHSINADYLDDAILYQNEAELTKGVLRGAAPDNRVTLERFASKFSISDPAATAWAAFEQLIYGEAKVASESDAAS